MGMGYMVTHTQEESPLAEGRELKFLRRLMTAPPLHVAPRGGA